MGSVRVQATLPQIVKGYLLFTPEVSEIAAQFQQNWEDNLRAQGIELELEVDANGAPSFPGSHDDDIAVHIFYSRFTNSPQLTFWVLKPHYLAISPLLNAQFERSLSDTWDNDLASHIPIWSNLVTGLSLYSINRCDLAIPILETSLYDIGQVQDQARFFPPLISFYLGNCHLRKQNFEDARVHLINAIVYLDSPIKPAAAFNLAWVQLQLGDEQTAFETIDDFLYYSFTDEERSRALTRRSQLYALAFRFDEAVADMDAAIELDPDNPYLYVERGQRLLLLYEWDLALADYNHALELNPNYADTYYYRGVLYASAPEGINARAEAIADFQQYLELAPNGAHTENAQHYLTQIQSQLDSLEPTETTPEPISTP